MVSWLFPEPHLPLVYFYTRFSRQLIAPCTRVSISVEELGLAWLLGYSRPGGRSVLIVIGHTPKEFSGSKTKQTSKHGTGTRSLEADVGDSREPVTKGSLIQEIRIRAKDRSQGRSWASEAC